MPKNVPIRLKLLLLAGIPVFGALILAAHVTQNAEERIATAVALGSIEDLATLSARMSVVVHELAQERSLAALDHGPPSRQTERLLAQYAKTDAAISTLGTFLGGRRLAGLPPRLARPLGLALSRLEQLKEFRKGSRALDLLVLLAFYNETNGELISATAALNRLSNDGEMLRAIAALVSVLEVKERVSRQQAVLNNAFATRQFAPGTYRALVKLTTEEEDYVSMLELTASDEIVDLYHASMRGEAAKQAAKLRQAALDAIEDELDTDVKQWDETETRVIERLRGLEVLLNRRVAEVAVSKIAQARSAANFYYGISGAVLLVSVVLTALMARGIARSISSLSETALAVRTRRDYSVRARRRSNDELGALTEAFNDMLGGIEAREAELAKHRDNLERLVGERTQQLEAKNAATRLVLNTVGQGLATVAPSGELVGERSRAFDDWFGPPAEGVAFSAHLAPGDARLERRFRLAWNQVREAVLPVELALAQLPRRLASGARTFALDYKPMGEHNADLLLVVTDVTLEVQSQRAEAEQRQFMAVVERLVKDRAGFVEFLGECERLVHEVVSGTLDRIEVLRALHTLKGNCGVFEVRAIETLAHRLEDAMLSEGRTLGPEDALQLTHVWREFADRVRRLAGELDGSLVEVSRDELAELARVASAREPHAQIAELVERLEHERVAPRFRRAAEQIQALAERMGKGPVTVDIDAGDVRLPREAWAPFWTAFPHLLRNAVDHGLEAPAERREVGKREQGTITLRSAVTDDGVTIELSDDGAGIDWQHVRRIAEQRGLPCESQSDLELCLLEAGMTTRGQVTEVSGRGLGMGAVHAAVRVLDGTISVKSAAGRGTTIRLRAPLKPASSLA